MKHIVLLILVILNSGMSYSQYDVSIERLKYRTKYANADGTYNWYPISFITIDNPTFITDNNNHLYLISDSIDDKRLSLHSLLQRADCYHFLLPGSTELFTWGACFMTFSELDQFEDLIPKNYTETWVSGPQKSRQLTKDLTITEYSSIPDGYLFILMTGEAYNFLSFGSVCDGTYKAPIPFPDERAYYKVLIPYKRLDGE